MKKSEQKILLGQSLQVSPTGYDGLQFAASRCNWLQ